MRGSIMVCSTARVAWFAVASIVTLGVVGAVGDAMAVAADAPPSQKPVALTINPDGTVVWNGEPLASEPALKDKIARQTQQAPRLELDLQFHSVAQLSDSNRQTLLDIVELTARYGFVHVEATGGGVTLTVLGPSAAAGAAPK
jgi:biopolymer transport protein ExbD